MAILLAMLVAMPPVAAQHPAGGPPAGANPFPTLHVNATLSFASPNRVSPYFWGTTISPRSPLFPDEAQLLLAAGTRVLVWPGASTAEDYNPFNNTLESIASSGRPVWTSATTNEAQFVALCRAIGCFPILQVPGEINDTRFAARVVNYTVNTLGLSPVGWEIGNEPELWKHFDQPWANWTSSVQLPPTPSQYAWEVHNYTAAMQAIEPHAPIIGVPGTGRIQNNLSLSDWIAATVNVNGANLTSVAFHEYPAPGNLGKNQKANLTTFYRYIDSASGLPQRYQEAQSALDQSVNKSLSCGYSSANCPNLRVYVTEIGSALSRGAYNEYSQGFAGGLDLAAESLQGLELNVSNVDLFASVLNTSNSWITPSGTFRPEYTVYSQFLSRLGDEFYRANLTLNPGTTLNSSEVNLGRTLFAGATRSTTDHGRTDLLLVNLNTSSTANVALTLPGIGPHVPVEELSWSGNLNGTAALSESQDVHPTTAAPQATYYPGGLPTNFTLENQSIALFEAYPQGGQQVAFNETGVPSGARWFLSVDNRTFTSNASSLPVFLYNGTHTLAGVPIELPYGVTTLHERERLAASVTSPMTWTNGTAGPTGVPVAFSSQWAVNLTVSPPGSGTLSSNATWWNANASLPVTATSAPGYSFDRWVGFGTGSVNSTSPSIAPVVTSWINEVAEFRGAYPVTFNETGLRSALPWTVDVGGTNYSSTNATITIESRNGTHGFSVQPVAGYRSIPVNSSFNVSGSGVRVPVRFVSTAPPPKYPVTFNETGLPSGTNWSVSVRGTVYSSTTPNVSLAEVNGTFGFSVGTISGYRSIPTNASFQVAGGPVNVSITFIQKAHPGQTFPVDFQETGLPSGTAWSVTIRGALYSSAGTSVSLNETNGTYGYSVNPVLGYRSTPTNASFTVAGASVTVSIAFAAKTPPGTPYPVGMRETGLPNGTHWSVTIRGHLFASNSATISLNETNGTYGFAVTPIYGYRAIPTNSSFHVAGGPLNVSIAFVLRTPPGPEYPVTFVEEGLPSGTVWSVEVRGVATFSPTASLSVNETNGTYGFSVGYVPGYRPVPKAASFTVNGGPTNVTIAFHVVTGPLTYYAVEWTETGLPNGTFWSVDVRGEVVSGTGASLTLTEPNGSYGYNVSRIVGFHDATPNNGFLITGQPLVIALTFVALPTAFAVTWDETGLWDPVNWSITVAGVTHTDNQSWASLDLRNGTYPVVVNGPPGFVASPRVGSVTVNGAPVQLSVTFVRAMFSVRILASGLPQNLVWYVRLADVLTGESDDQVVLPEANGTYTYSITAPSGYYPSPSHGQVQVQAKPINLTVGFFHAGAGFLPPGVTVATLSVRAISVAGVGVAAAIGTFLLVGLVHRRSGNRSEEEFP